jgi:hypothetical protein
LHFKKTGYQILFSPVALTVALIGFSSVLRAEESTSASKLAQVWYLSFGDTMNYCVATGFRSAICPNLSTGAPGEERFTPQLPSGPLNALTLLQASESYHSGQSPKDWLLGLKIQDRKIKLRLKDSQEILMANAKWLLAEILYDERQFEAASKLYTEVLPFFRGRAKFHQERAWAQYFLGKFSLAVGSMMSAESPLVYKMPYFDKYFLKALIERDTCQYDKALATLAAGRRDLSATNLPVTQIPWVKSCNDKKLGSLCDRLTTWAQAQLKKSLDQSKIDLDFIELELAEKGFKFDAKTEVKSVVWPYVGEKWADELGNYSVEVPQQCPQN